jgi:dihydroorotate dehydrogenase electron transfer subunit
VVRIGLRVFELIEQQINRPQMVKISKIEIETPHIKTFHFQLAQLKDIALPGQFLMIWLPKIDEIPISISDVEPDLAISVKNLGDATNALHSMAIGDRIGVRGPYGNGFSIKGESPLIVGGGIGMAPFPFLIRELQKKSSKITVISGARTKDEVLYEKKLQKLSKQGLKIIITTDDGSLGEKGYASAIATQYLQTAHFDHVYACGPELMIQELFETTEKLKIPMQASLERYMKCGIGLCGQCCLDPLGYRTCLEGPVFHSEILRNISDFGKYRRDPTGRKVVI